MQKVMIFQRNTFGRRARTAICGWGVAVFLLLVFIPTVSMQAQRIGNFNQLGGSLVTTAQRDFIDKSLASGYYSEGKVVSTASMLEMFKEEGMGFFIPGSSKAYMAEKVDFDGAKTPYYDEIWMGKIEGDEMSNILLLKKDALLAGFIQSTDGFYSIIPAGDNIALFLKHEVGAYEAIDCGNHAIEQVVEAQTIDPCMMPASTCSATIDVLVLVSPGARDFIQGLPGAGTNPFIPALFVLIGLESSNLAMVNSGIPNKRFRFTIEGFDFPFDALNDIREDVNNLAASQEARDLRNDNGGDLVVLLTNQDYFPVFDRVREIGPNNNNSYAIVEVPFLLNPRWTFAHEIAHLLGARHQRPENFDGINGDNTDVCAHGFLFNGGTLGLKRTILAASGIVQVPQGTPIFEMVPGGRLLNFSNPNVIVDGGATGTVDDDNARMMANTACVVSQFRPDPNFRIQLNVSENEVCMQDIFAGQVLIFEPSAAYPGQPPYTINWNVTASNATYVLIPVQVSYPQTMTVTVTVTSSDGIALTRSKIVNIINFNGYLQSENSPIPTHSVHNNLNSVKIGSTNPDNISNSIFPNPATEELIIRGDLLDDSAEIEVIDVNGRTLTLEYHKIEGGVILDVRPFPRGKYFIRVMDKAGTVVHSFIKM